MPDPVPTSTTTRIVNRQSGEVAEVESSRVAEALAARDPTGAPLFDLDTPEQAAERQRQRAFGGVAGQAGAVVAGAARTATFGGSDQVVALADELTDSTSGREALSAVRELNPNATLLGEVGGGVAMALASGGGSVAATEGRGALSLLTRAATAPTRLVTGAAELAEGGAARLLAGRGGLQTVGRLAAGGAVEGAAGGVQVALTEDALGNRELTAESLLADVGLGALLGAGTGGAFGLGSSALARSSGALRNATSEVLDRTFRRVTGEGLREGVGELWDVAARRVADVSALATGADRNAVETALSSSGRRTRELVARGDELYETATREIQRAGSEAEIGLRHTQDFWSRGLKREVIDAQVSGERVLDQLTASRTSIARVRELAESVVANPGFEAAGIAGNAREILRYADEAQSIIDTASQRRGIRLQSMTSGDLFQSLDQMKRAVGRVQQRIERQDRGSVFLSQIRDVYDEALRRPLEDANLWGGIADTQRQVNAAYATHLERRQAFTRAFLADGARDTADPFRALQEMDSSRVASFVRAAGTQANDTRRTVFREVLSSGAELADVMSRHIDMGDVAEEAATASASARRAIETFDALENDVASVNQFRALEQGTGVERALLAQAGGFVLGGPLGAALATAIASPSVLARGLGAIERASARVSGRIELGVGRYVRDALAKGRLIASGARAAARRTVRSAPRLAASQSLAEYDRRSREAIDAAADPRRTLERIEERTQDLVGVAPQTRDALIAQSMRAVTFLADRVPPSSAPLQAALPSGTRRLPPSSTERARFLRFQRAAESPLTIVDDLEGGTVTPEAVETARELYPQLYALMQSSVARAFAEHAREGDDIPYTSRMALGQLFGADTDPSLRGVQIAEAQARFSTDPQQPGDAPRTSRTTVLQTRALQSLADEPQTRTQRAEGRAR